MPSNSLRDEGSLGYSSDAEAAYLNRLWGVPDSETTSGIEVDEMTALNYAGVYSAISLIAAAMATMPIQIFRRNENGTTEEMPDHPANNIVRLSPDGEMPAFNFIETLQGHSLLRGNGLAEIVRNGRGQAMNAYLIDPSKVQYSKSDSGNRQYKIWTRKGTKHLDESQVFHIPAFSYDGWVGKSPITLARESIGLGLAAENYGAAFYGSGGKPKGFLTKPNTMTARQRQTLRQEWRELHEGIRNFHSVGVLSGGLDWKQISTNPQDAEFLSTRIFQIKDMCRWFRIPPHMLADMDGSKYGSVEQMMMHFAVYTLLAWVKKWENQLNLKMFTEKESFRYYTAFNMDELLRADRTTRTNSQKTLLQSGLRTPDELRREDNKNAYPDGIGEHPLIMASQMARLKDVADGKTLKNNSSSQGSDSSGSSGSSNTSTED